MSPLIKPSTRAFFREARRIPGYPLLEWLHGYFYLRFTYFYIGNAMGVRFPANLFNRLAQFWHHIFTRRQHPPQPGGITFADTYHGKVVPLETARQLVLVREEIRINYPEQVLPYALARDLILKQPDHIVALACPCRTARPQPCLPLDVCLIVGEPFASLVMEHHANRAHWVTPQTALDILQAEEQRGHVHHAFFKQAVLGRFYAICNCCSCCCGAMQAHRHGTPMLASSGYISQVSQADCTGCSTCETICPFNAIEVVCGVESHKIVSTELCQSLKKSY